MDGQRKNSLTNGSGSAKGNSISVNLQNNPEPPQRKSIIGSHIGVHQENLDNEQDNQDDGPMDYKPHTAFDEEEEYQGQDVSQAVENSEPSSSQQDVDNHGVGGVGGVGGFAKPYNPYNQPNQDNSYMKGGTMTNDNSMMNPSMLNQSGFMNNPYNAQMGYPPNMNNSAMDQSMATFIGNNGQAQYTEGSEELPATATSRLPQEIRCPTCGRRGITTIQGVVGTGTVTVAVALCFCGCFVCSCVPCCMEECKDIQHTCSNCGAEVGVKEFTVSLF